MYNMEILVILGFIFFAVFAVFGIIDGIIKMKYLDDNHKATLKRIEEDRDKAERERLQYLAGIKTKAEVTTIPAKLGPDIVGELMQETEVEVMKELSEKKQKISAQYTRR